jgi:hypothetical protein
VRALDDVAGNGVINRRVLLTQGTRLRRGAGAAGTVTRAAAEPLQDKAVESGIWFDAQSRRRDYQSAATRLSVLRLGQHR